MEDTDWFAERKEKQQERCYWRRVGFIAFAAILVLFLTFLIFPKKAHADLVARQGNDSVRLTSEPCKNEAILNQIRPEYQDRFKAGIAEVNGKKYPMCWTAANEDVFMLYEDGDKGRVPMIVFDKELGV